MRKNWKKQSLDLTETQDSFYTSKPIVKDIYTQDQNKQEYNKYSYNSQIKSQNHSIQKQPIDEDDKKDLQRVNKMKELVIDLKINNDNQVHKIQDIEQQAQQILEYYERRKSRVEGLVNEEHRKEELVQDINRALILEDYEQESTFRDQLKKEMKKCNAMNLLEDERIMVEDSLRDTQKKYNDYVRKSKQKRLEKYDKSPRVPENTHSCTYKYIQQKYGRENTVTEQYNINRIIKYYSNKVLGKEPEIITPVKQQSNPLRQKTDFVNKNINGINKTIKYVKGYEYAGQSFDRDQVFGRNVNKVISIANKVQMELKASISPFQSTYSTRRFQR